MVYLLFIYYLILSLKYFNLTSIAEKLSQLKISAESISSAKFTILYSFIKVVDYYKN